MAVELGYNNYLYTPCTVIYYTPGNFPTVAYEFWPPNSQVVTHMTLILRVKIAQDVSSLSNITTDLTEFETRLICPHLKLSSQYCAAYQLWLADTKTEHGRGQAGRQDMFDGWKAATFDGGIEGEE